MWQGIEGHDAIVERFRRSLERGRLASTFLFAGPPGVGKRAFAKKLAKSLLCQTRPEAELNPCGTCDACIQVEAGTHPDLIQISKPADKTEIPLSAFLGDKEGKARSGLCHAISLRPFMGGRKVAIIDDADALNEEGANCLLKTLEEPPPRSVLILIGTSVDKQLPTIRSRAQIIRFQPLETETVERLLQSTCGIEDAEEARRLATFSGGSLDQALEMADEELWTFRKQLLDELAKPRLNSVALAKTMLAFIEAAGKDAAPRRRRTRQIIGIANEFYRQLLRRTSGLAPAGDAALCQTVERAYQNTPCDAEQLAQRAERCVEALEHVDRNLHQSTLVEAWLDDLR